MWEKAVVTCLDLISQHFIVHKTRAHSSQSNRFPAEIRPGLLPLASQKQQVHDAERYVISLACYLPLNFASAAPSHTHTQQIYV